MTPRLQRSLATLACTALLALAARAADAPAPVYSNNFEKSPLGKPEKGFLVFSGAFEVKDVGGNKVLELPGEPLETMGVMFGPADQALIEVRAKVWGAVTGKRFPEFGIGAADVSGYRLLLLPRQARLVIRRADVEVASVPYASWKNETWTAFRLSVEKAGDAWKVTGSAWPGDADASKGATVTFDEKEQPATGHGSIWGMPFSGKPLRFDDLEVRVSK